MQRCNCNLMNQQLEVHKYIICIIYNLYCMYKQILVYSYICAFVGIIVVG
jgi:hypothetical protein